MTSSRTAVHIGEKWAFLTLLERFYKPSKGGILEPYWKCRCICGNIIERHQKGIYNGKTVSCGCQHTRNNTGVRNCNWQGRGELPLQYFSSVRDSAQYRGLSFNITIDFAWCLYLEQQGKCAITGWDIKFSTKRKIKQGIEQTCSLDRIDSKFGYEEWNVAWVHKVVNIAKNDSTLKEFITMCRAAVEHYDNSASNVPLTQAT